MSTTKFRIRSMDVVGIGLSVFFLWLTLRNFSFGPNPISWDIKTVFFLIISVLLTVLPTCLNALRFRLFFLKNRAAFKKITPYSSFFIAHFYNAVLPGNVGEAIKIYHISKKNNINHKDVLAFWVSEKFMDAMMLPFLFAWPLFVLNDTRLRIVLSALMAIIVLSLLYAVIGARYEYFAKLPFRAIPIRKVRRYLFSIYIRFRSVIFFFWKSRLIYLFFGGSLLFYVLVLAFNFTILRAANVPAKFISLESLMLLSIISIISRFLPSAPSSVGVLHYGIYASLIILSAHYGIFVDESLNDKFVLASIFFHFIFFFSEVSLGSYFVFTERKWLFRRNNKI